MSLCFSGALTFRLHRTASSTRNCVGYEATTSRPCSIQRWHASARTSSRRSKRFTTCVLEIRTMSAVARSSLPDRSLALTARLPGAQFQGRRGWRALPRLSGSVAGVLAAAGRGYRARARAGGEAEPERGQSRHTAEHHPPVHSEKLTVFRCRNIDRRRNAASPVAEEVAFSSFQTF